MQWLKKAKQIKTIDNYDIDIYKLDYDSANQGVMSSWAKHFRNHYCLDSEIDRLKPPHISRTDYLNTYKFPSETRPGPSIQSGDFSEILISDFLSYILKYWVPRTRYGSKTIRNESTKGSDVMGFQFGEISLDDTMMIVESKAQFSGTKALPRLQVAIDDSVKDSIRIGESLNAIKQRFFDKNQQDDVKKIERFQDPIGKPYKEKYGAAALFTTEVYDEAEIIKTATSNHPGTGKLTLIVIQGEDMMSLVRKLYKLASDEA